MLNVKYKEKFQLCENLVSTGKKRITSADIKEEAAKLNISYQTAQRAWKNFVQSGGTLIDRRGTSCWGTIATRDIRGLISSGKLRRQKYPTKQTPKTAKEAGDIIIEYMTTKIRTCELLTKYGVTRDQFYNWIREIEVSGTLLGVKIIDTKKYAKLKILDAIRLHKYPYTKKKSIVNMTESEVMAYLRLADVLLLYLPRTKN